MKDFDKIKEKDRQNMKMRYGVSGTCQGELKEF